MLLDEQQMQTVREALTDVWQQIAHDVEVEDNEEAIEVTIDGDKLAIYGYMDAHGIVKKLVQEEGYLRALYHLNENILLY